MQSYCAVTHEVNCKCIGDRPGISGLKVDLKAALRKLFTDHAVFTANVMKSIVDGGKDTKQQLDRLLLNQKDIGDQLEPSIGCEKADKITELLTEHIKAAGDVITAAVKKDKMLNVKIDILFTNSNSVAEALTSLNPELLPLNFTCQMFHDHNQSVIDMTIARIKGEFTEEIQIYDSYYNDILVLSDAIFDALP
jgi:wobble nucleotide-excising tRNase